MKRYDVIPRWVRSHRWLVLLTCATLLNACSSVALGPGTSSADARWGPDGQRGWSAQTLPGKRPTEYRAEEKDGRAAWLADARQSASLWRRSMSVEPAELGGLTFSWWAQGHLVDASVADADVEDASARVVLAFDGDRTRLSARTRMLFELAQTLTGEEPPYATLMYVWDAHAPVGTVVVNPRSDRIRKIVVESGPAHLQQWRMYQRDVVADFKRAFGEMPGNLIGIAVMTDTDNTQSSTRTWYGPIEVLARTAAQPNRASPP